MTTPAYFLFFYLLTQQFLFEFYTAPTDVAGGAVLHVPDAKQYFFARICGTAWHAGQNGSLDFEMRRESDQLFLIGKNQDGSRTEIRLEHVRTTGIYFFGEKNSACFISPSGEIFRTENSGDGAVRISEIAFDHIRGTFCMELKNKRGHVLTYNDGAFQWNSLPAMEY